MTHRISIAVGLLTLAISGTANAGAEEVTSYQVNSGGFRYIQAGNSVNDGMGGGFVLGRLYTGDRFDSTWTDSCACPGNRRWGYAHGYVGRCGWLSNGGSDGETSTTNIGRPGDWRNCDPSPYKNGIRRVNKEVYSNGYAQTNATDGSCGEDGRQSSMYGGTPYWDNYFFGASDWGNHNFRGYTGTGFHKIRWRTSGTGRSLHLRGCDGSWNCGDWVYAQDGGIYAWYGGSQCTITK